MSVSGKRILPVVLGIFITSAIVVSAFPSGNALAAGQIVPRKVTLSTSAPGATGVTHTFDFTAPNVGSATIASISFTYCTKARDVSCVTPGDPSNDMDASGATLGTTVGVSGWTVHAGATANNVVISGTGVQFNNTTLTIPLNNIKNPNVANTAFYVNVQTFTSSDGTGTAVDEGWVAAATANQIELQGTMPESLIFCTGSLISDTSGLPDCSTAQNDTVTFNQLFSPTQTATATSMMAASTNASSGYAITYAGPTLTSGGNPITPMDNGSNGATTSTVGKSQFGMNLAVNTTPAIGANIAPADNGTNLLGAPSTNYDTADNFKFTTGGEEVAHSTAGTDIQAYTVSYMVNVDGAQTAGTYTTTLTYICTATF